MSRSSKLVLRKETLSDLAPEALQGVVGGTTSLRFVCTFEIEQLNDLSFEFCPTLPVEVCTAR